LPRQELEPELELEHASHADGLGDQSSRAQPQQLACEPELALERVLRLLVLQLQVGALVQVSEVV
tara:strand:+ start:106926 stop:107120 length:195 start_codon:yes stop_codon:yes gene_type:complete